MYSRVPTYTTHSSIRHRNREEGKAGKALSNRTTPDTDGGNVAGPDSITPSLSFEIQYSVLAGVANCRLGQTRLDGIEIWATDKRCWRDTIYDVGLGLYP